MVPMFESVKVPPEMSACESLLAAAAACSRDSSAASCTTVLSCGDAQGGAGGRGGKREGRAEGWARVRLRGSGCGLHCANGQAMAAAAAPCPSFEEGSSSGVCRC